MSNDVYILQKDLPIVKAGRKFERIDNFYYLEGNKQASCLHRDWVEYNSEWFKRPDEIHRYSLSDSIGRFEIMSPRKEVEVIFNGVKLLHNVNEQTPNPAIPKDKEKEVLFTTEDGVGISEGMQFVSVQKNSFYILSGCSYPLIKPDSWVTFSTKEKAQEYIDNFKLKFSYQDLVNAMYGIVDSGTALLISNKLNSGKKDN